MLINSKKNSYSNQVDNFHSISVKIIFDVKKSTSAKFYL